MPYLELAIRIDQQVPGLEISMQNVCRVNILQANGGSSVNYRSDAREVPTFKPHRVW